MSETVKVRLIADCVHGEKGKVITVDKEREAVWLASGVVELVEEPAPPPVAVAEVVVEKPAPRPQPKPARRVPAPVRKVATKAKPKARRRQ
jgi:hypothetical protein